MPQLSFHSPVGDITLHEDDGALVSLDWGWVPDQHETPLLARARDQIHAYFDDGTTAFDLPLRPHGTPFQQKVWDALVRIPPGTTMTYGSLGKTLRSHDQGLGRAVGLACARNPLPILIPCHRVVAANRHLNGYSGDGGLETKASLLRLEGVSLDSTGTYVSKS